MLTALLVQMCRDRGYDVSPEDSSMELEDFIAKFGSKPSIGKPSRSDLNTIVSDTTTGEALGVFLPSSNKVGIADVRIIIEEMTESDIGAAIVVVKGGMTPSAKKALLEAPSASNLKIQAFDEAELLVNITEHDLVPKHELLSAAEKTALLQRYKLKEQQLPRIKVSDPVARYVHESFICRFFSTTRCKKFELEELANVFLTHTSADICPIFSQLSKCLKKSTLIDLAPLLYS